MFAQINLAGSSNLETFGPDTKQMCKNWLDFKAKKMIESGIQVTDTYPRLLLTNKEAKKQRYRDGSHVFRHFDRVLW
jgi:hypothetical protein